MRIGFPFMIQSVTITTVWMLFLNATGIWDDFTEGEYSQIVEGTRATLLVCRTCPLPSTELSACVPLRSCVAVCVLADQRARRTADQRAHHTDEVCGRRSGGRCVCLVGLPQKTERRDGVLLEPSPQALVRKRSTSGLSSRTMRIISSKSSPLTDLPCTLSSCIPASSAHSRSA